MIVLREYVNEVEALIARSVLEAHNIPAMVLRDNAGGMLPSMAYVYPVRLAVRESDRLLALHILDSPFVESDDSDELREDLGLPGAP